MYRSVSKLSDEKCQVTGTLWTPRSAKMQHHAFFSSPLNFMEKSLVVTSHYLPDSPSYIHRGYLQHENLWISSFQFQQNLTPLLVTERVSAVCVKKKKMTLLQLLFSITVIAVNPTSLSRDCTFIAHTECLHRANTSPPKEPTNCKYDREQVSERKYSRWTAMTLHRAWWPQPISNMSFVRDLYLPSTLTMNFHYKNLLFK